MGIETVAGLALSAVGTVGSLASSGGGGGGSSMQSVTSTPDPMAQAFDMLRFNMMQPHADKASQRSDVYDKHFQDYYLPVERKYLGAYERMLPEYEALGRANIQAQLGLLPAAADLDQQTLEARSQLLGPSTKLGLERIGAARALLPTATESIGNFMDAANEGVDPNAWSQRAGVDVQQGLSQSVNQMNRNAARLGLNPGSGSYTNAMRDMYTEGAAKKAGAMTDAWRKAEDENFKRLGLGAQTGAQVFGGSGS